jgi:hypothetical protein
VDALHSLILILHAKHQRIADKKRIRELEGRLAMKGLKARAEASKQALNVLTNDVGNKFDKLTVHIQSQHARVDNVFSGAAQKVTNSVDQMAGAVNEIAAILDDVEGDNGGPTLDGSKQPSNTSQETYGNEGNGR